VKKSFRSTLILLAVFIALVAWFQIYEKRVKPKQAEADEKTKQLVTLSKDDIQEIDITRLKVQPPDDAPPGTEPPSKETSKIVLKLAGKEWNLAEPVQDSADGGTVNSMISTITSTKHERIVDENPADLTPYGLKTPRLTITVRKGGSTTAETVKIGGNTPTGFSSYAQVGNAPKVYRVPRSLRTNFDKQVKEVRNKTVISGWTRADISEVEIQNKKENIVLKKPNPDKEEWNLARDHVPADTTEWNKTLNAILEVKAVDFPSEDGKELGKYGLSSPTARIVLTKGKENKKLAIRVGKVGEKVYLTRDDRTIVYEVDKDLLSKIETKSEQYRSLRLANFNRFDVKRIKLEKGKDIVELLKEEKTGWGFPTDPSAKLNSTKVDSLLTQLQDIKLTRYLTPGAPKVTSPLLTIRVFEKKGTEEKEQVSLLFGKTQGKLVPVNRSDLDLGFLIKEEDFAKLFLSQKDFIQAPEPKAEPKVENSGEHSDDHGHDHKGEPGKS